MEMDETLLVQPILMPKTVDVGDYVVVVNARHVHLSGSKPEQKKYRWHTGWPGGLKEITFDNLVNKHPTKVCLYTCHDAGMYR